jgi:hypothetical protein
MTTKQTTWSETLVFAVGGTLLLFALYLILVTSTSGVLATGLELGQLLFGFAIGFCGFLIMKLNLKTQ